MAMEVTCGQCHGRLLIETPGVVVACPHCGVHLSIPAPEQEAATPDPVVNSDTAISTPDLAAVKEDSGDIELNFGSPLQFEEAPAEETHFEEAVATSVFAETEEHEPPLEEGWHSAPSLFLGQPESPTFEPAEAAASPAMFTSPLMEPSDNPATEQTVAMYPTFGEAPVAADATVTMPSEAVASAQTEETFLSSSQQFSLDIPAEDTPAVTEMMFASATPEQEATVAMVSPEELPRTIVLPGDAATEVPMSSSQQFMLAPAGEAATAGSEPNQLAVPVADQPVGSSASVVRADAVSAPQNSQSMLLMVVGSYASAITIVLIYVLLFSGREHKLESLPDIKPTIKKGEVAAVFYSPKNDVPWGHVLTLGQSQRFGSLLVTPVKVTKGTVKFQHFSGKSVFERFDSEPLLKLWLKFENVSKDQTFAPLDSLLVFKRSNPDKRGNFFANNFLVKSENRKPLKSIFHVYDLPPLSEFEMVGQKLDTEIAPGATWETFIPSEEEAVKLDGDLVWRVHFRKGYHPESFRGVTTLIDVKFNSRDIKNEG